MIREPLKGQLLLGSFFKDKLPPLAAALSLIPFSYAWPTLAQLTEMRTAEDAVGFSSKANKTWKECVQKAEHDRSSRDLKFFIESRKLSNARQWFIAHNRNNEELFCFEIESCEVQFGIQYSETGSTAYPSCKIN